MKIERLQRVLKLATMLQAGQAALKIENALPAHIRQQCGTMIKATSARFSPRVRHEGFDDTFVTLQTAVRTRHNVSLRFSKLVAKNVAEVLWHPTQKLTWHKDGAMTFDAQVDGTASHASSYKPQRGDMKKPGASPRVTRFKIYFSPERA